MLHCIVLNLRFKNGFQTYFCVHNHKFSYIDLNEVVWQVLFLSNCFSRRMRNGRSLSRRRWTTLDSDSRPCRWGVKNILCRLQEVSAFCGRPEVAESAFSAATLMSRSTLNSFKHRHFTAHLCWSTHFYTCLSDSDEKEDEEYEKEEVGEDGEIILVSGDKVSGPWNKSGAPPSAAPGESSELVWIEVLVEIGS